MSRARTNLARAVAALLALTFVRPLWASPGDITQVPAPLIGSDPPAAAGIDHGDASVSTQTGAFTYSYPITVPPGRMGLQPTLSLAYSSQAPIYGGIAMGWALSVPEIKVDTSRSVLIADMQGIAFGTGNFVSSMAGGRPLVEVEEPGALTNVRTFRAQNDGSYARYELMESGTGYRWRVLTLDGNTHYFGDATLAAASTMTWSPLTRTVDPFGNTIEYEWEEWNLKRVRYTSNPGAGLDPFALVEFDWDTEATCTPGVEPLGAQEDRVRQIVSGRRRLRAIRSFAQSQGGPLQHTREITLTYSPDQAQCDEQHGPMRVLTGIQESAWGPNALRVDLPAVTFDYNRFERTFDELKQINGSTLPWHQDPFPDNLGWGVRPDSHWPTVNGMFLDFDGDGLVDRLFSVEPWIAGSECVLGWQKNLGRNAQGTLVFDGPAYETLPRLPWKGGDSKNDRESCSLSSQLTMVTNLTVGSQAPCQTTTGTYLVYRWLDLTGDDLPDLVTAIHNDPNHFDPNADDWFGPWPSCDEEPSCPAMSATCMDEAVDCPAGLSCRPDQAKVQECQDGASMVGCNEMMRQIQDSATGECQEAIGSDIDPNWCVAPLGLGPRVCPQACQGGDRLPPPYLGDGVCDVKTTHAVCGRYPWMIYENLGNGQLANTPQIKYQPIPLESDGGDSAFGGGNISSPRHAIQDIDGDGNLDALVRGRYTDQDVDVLYETIWWLVFPGDGDGNFLTYASGSPFVWIVPSRAPISGSCVSDPGGVCSALRSPPVEALFHDVKGLSTILDLNGDHAADLVWKVAPTQFTNPDENVIWQNVNDTDDILVFRGTGRNFEFQVSPHQPQGTPLTSGGVQQFARALVTADTYTPSHFMSAGGRQTMSRFVDYDADGRLDVITRSRQDEAWDEKPSLHINGGGKMLPGQELDQVAAENVDQTTVAAETGWLQPRQFGWFNKEDLLDIDGDGLPEAWELGDPVNGYRYRRDSSTQPLRLMKSVDNGRGGRIDVAYAATTNAQVVVQAASQRKATPSPMWVVHTMEVHDTWDLDVSRNTYHYEYPVWNESPEQSWGFRGFEKVEVTSPSRSRKVDAYRYDVDWSGRLSESRTYSFEQPDADYPRTISETVWESRTLFGGAITTYHSTHARSWLCGNAQTEAACKNTGSGFQHTSWTYQHLPLIGERQLYYANQTYLMDGPYYDVGDRRTELTSVLFADGDDYRLRQTSSGTAQLVDALPWTEEWASYEMVTFDVEYRQRQSNTTYFDMVDPTKRAVASWTYDPETGLVETERSPNQYPSGPVTAYVYDATGRFATSVTDPAGHTVERIYDPGTGALVWEGGPNSASCGGGCTNREQRWNDIDGLGRTTAVYVNVPIGASTSWQKTLVSRTTYTDTVVAGVRRKVVVEGLIEYGTNRWARNETRLDGKGRPDEVVSTTGLGFDAVTTYDYDHRGQLVTVTLPDPSQNSAATVTYTYGFDSLGRPTSTRRPSTGGAPSGVDLEYDGLIHLRKEVAGEAGGPAAVTQLRHDNFGHLVEVREYTSFAAGTNAETTYEYDAHNLVRRIENPDGVVTELAHDMGGRRVAIERAGKTWSFGYLPGGQLEWEAIPAPHPSLKSAYTNTYTYDVLGRPKSQSAGARELSLADIDTFGVGTISFTYDACPLGVGRLCRVDLPEDWLATSFEYDAEGNGIAETRAYDLAGISGEWVQRRTFGPGGRIVTQTYADNQLGLSDATSARLAYDDRGLPRELSWIRNGVPGVTVANQTRNVAGLVTHRSTTFITPGWVNLTATFAYDKLTRLTSQTVTDNLATQHARQQISYLGQDDPRKLRQWMGSAYYELDYAYDERHQLTGVSEIGDRFESSYTFADSGILEKVVVDATVPGPGADTVPRDVYYEYASTSDPEAVSAIRNSAGGDAMYEYEYDIAGNMVHRRSGAVESTFAYDGDDQLRRAVVTDSDARSTWAEEYHYDHSGQRAAVVTRDAGGAVRTARLFIGDTELVFDDAAALATTYAHLGLGTPVARVKDRGELELQYQGTARSVLLSITPDGQTRSGFVYGPYGELLEITGNAVIEQRRRYNDKFRDEATGLLYYGARYYDPNSLTWTQGDPLYRFQPDGALASPRGGQLYLFDRGNPMRYLDPDGRDTSDTAWDVVHWAGMMGGPVTLWSNLSLGKTIYDSGGDPDSWLDLASDIIGQGRIEVAVNVTMAAYYYRKGDKEMSVIYMAGIALPEHIEVHLKRAARRTKQTGRKAVELARPYIQKWVKDAVWAKQLKEGWLLRDPNTRKVITGVPDVGHKPGYEHRRLKERAEAVGMSQEEFNDMMNHPDLYHLEDPSSNRSHEHEKPKYAPKSDCEDASCILKGLSTNDGGGMMNGPSGVMY